MSDIFEWIKKMIYLAIFLTLLLQILPNSTYKKYVKFFAGLVFVITILSPLMQVFAEGNLEDEILTQIERMEDQQERDIDFSAMEEKQQEFYVENAASVLEVLEQ